MATNAETVAFAKLRALQSRTVRVISLCADTPTGAETCLPNCWTEGA